MKQKFAGGGWPTPALRHACTALSHTSVLDANLSRFSCGRFMHLVDMAADSHAVQTFEKERYTHKAGIHLRSQAFLM